MEIYNKIAQASVLEVSQFASEHKEALLLRDDSHSTPLSAAIKLGNVDKVSALLALPEASASVFVHGYASNSLVCTLPLATQPSSSIFTHPPPISVEPALLELLDDAVASNVKKMVANEEAEATRKKMHAAAEKLKKDAAQAAKTKASA